MPSSPILQAGPKTVGLSPSMSSLNLYAGAGFGQHHFERSSSRSEDLCRSIHSICSGSSSQPRATSSNAPFMDGPIVCVARFLASAAFCRYSSERDDMQGKHWKDDAVPQNSPNLATSAALVSWLFAPGIYGANDKSRPVAWPWRVGAPG